MPRKARIDAPGALHHIIIRGIEKRPIFRDEVDRNHFLDRLETILTESSTPCYAWALMNNHVHLLLRTGLMPIATVMRRLLTGYAQQFNRRHKRHGQLFQNRYKSILCEEDAYLLELIRYIHLNPIRGALVQDLEELGKFPFAGHSVLMGKRNRTFQDVDYVLAFFGKTASRARKAYDTFVSKGLEQGKRPELTGGGLLRSFGGWSGISKLRSKEQRIKGDERILGSSEFVEGVLALSKEQFEEKARLKARGLDLNTVTKNVANYYGVETGELKSANKRPKTARARAVFCYLATRKLGESVTEIARILHITPSAVTKSARRGEAFVAEMDEDGLLGEFHNFTDVP
jgi:REP element-mobilizing transposase RayT